VTLSCWDGVLRADARGPGRWTLETPSGTLTLYGAAPAALLDRAVRVYGRAVEVFERGQRRLEAVEVVGVEAAG
jgi:hypothetical protein